MLSCNDVLAELSNYLDDQVTAEVKATIEQHLAQCRTCTALYDSTRKTLVFVTDSGSFELSAPASTEIVDRIMARVRTRPGSK